MLLLGYNIIIKNTQLLRYAQEKGIKDFSVFENMNIDFCIDLISFIEPKLTKQILEDEIDKDLNFWSQIVTCITQNISTGDEKKKTAAKKRVVKQLPVKRRNH